MTMYDFALRLLKHRGLFPRELPPALLSAALSAAVRKTYQAGGDFAAISRTPGFIPALSGTLSDLEEGWIGTRELREAERRAAARNEPARAARWREWRKLFLAAERAVAALGGMSRRRIFQEAVAGFEQPGYPFRVHLFGFYDFTRLQWTLVEALLSSGLLEEVYFPALFVGGVLSPAFAYAAGTWERLLAAFEGNATILDDDPPKPLVEVRRRLFCAPAGRKPGPALVRILSAPHEEGQWRLAARRVRRWLDEEPGAEVLVAARILDDEGAAAWERTAAEYGICTARRLSVPLASVPLVRVLLQMIEAAVRDFPRRTVLEILSSPYRRLESARGGPLPRPDLWEVMARELLVVSGDDWERRLEGTPYRDGDEKDGGESASWRREREEQLILLRGEVRVLRESLRDLLEARDFGDLSRRLERLLRERFWIADDGTPEAERDLRALSALFALLDDFGRIPEEEVFWPGAAAALEEFAALVSSRSLFVGEKGGLRVPGVVAAGDLFSLRGVTADKILFLSVNEEVVPARLGEDPLLPDEEREELNRLVRRAGLPDALSLRRRNAAEEKLLFALPAASARKELAFGVLRSDAAGAVRSPSRYLLDLLSRFAGPEVFSEDWLRVSGAAVEFLPRSPAAALEGPGPKSARERALSSWRQGTLPAEAAAVIPWDRVAGTLSTLRARAKGLALFPERVSAGKGPSAWSATELDDLARCPYRYFLAHRLGLAPAEEPEEEDPLSPAEAGTLVHEILRRLGQKVAAGGKWDDPGTEAQEVMERFAGRSKAVLPGLFRLLCARIVQDLAAFVKWERRRGEAEGAARVEAVELSFELPASPPRPPLRGRVDRLNRAPDGAVEIVDYKYRDGSGQRPPLDLAARAILNQIPVYLSFAESLRAPSEVRATLLFLRSGVRAVTVDGKMWEGIRQEWAWALERWLALAASGRYPPLPHHRFGFGFAAPPRYCDYCPFADHCRVAPAFFGAEEETAALVRRVGGDPVLSAVAELRPPRGG